MKFLHLADLHLGKIVSEKNLLEDQRYILQEILNIAKENNADAILIAGDIYDKGVPSEEAVQLFDWFLNTAASQGTAIIAISGNHDSEERLNFGTSFFKSHHIFIAAKYTGELSHVTLSDAYGPIHFYLLPYVKRSLVAHYHEDWDTSTYNAAVNSVIQNANITESERNVILSHQFVTAGGKEPEVSGSESVRPESVGTIERIDHSVYAPFDYVALGHIHRPQKVGRDTVRYSGSPLKYSFSEVNQNKSVPLITIKEKGNIKVECVPLVPLRDVRHLKGRLEDLLKPENIIHPDDYVYITLTDENIIMNAMEKASFYYKNVMNINYDNNHTKEIESFDFNAVDQNKTLMELFSDFYEDNTNRKPSEEENAILKEAAKKAGIAI